jgi:hypothetical protein
MGNENSCKRIVGTRSGSRTGEIIYATEDGRTWTNQYQPYNTQATGVDSRSYGYVHNGYMCPRPDDH